MRIAPVAALVAAFSLLAVGGQAAVSATTPVACGANLNTAYQAAAPGDTLTLGACTYPGTTLLYQSSKASASSRVVFQGQLGTVVADLNLRGAQHVEFRDLKITEDVYGIPQNNTSCGQDVKDVRFENVSPTAFFFRSAIDVSVVGGQVGPRHNGTPTTVGPFNGCTLPQNVSFDDVHWFNIDSDNCAGGISACHIECMFVQGVDGLVVKNSRFEQCAVFDVFMSQIVGSAQIRNVLFENNVLDAATDGGFYSMRVNPDGGSIGLELQNNTFRQAVSFGANTILSGCGNNSVSGMPAAQTEPCSPPPPPTTTEPLPTTTAPPPTTTEPPPPAAYHPACEPTCDEQIETQKARADALVVQLADLQARVDAALADLEAALAKLRP